MIDMIKRWMDRHIRNRLFSKIIIFYSCIAILFITCLTILSTYIIQSNKSKEIINKNSDLIQKIYSTVNSKYNTAVSIHQSIFANSAYRIPIFAFLKKGSRDFFSQSFKTYIDTDISYIKRLESFIYSGFIQDEDIASITLYSMEHDTMLHYNSLEPKVYYKRPEFINNKQNNSRNYVVNTNFGTLNPPNEGETISVVLDIKDTITLQTIGKLFVNYHKNCIDKVYNSFTKDDGTQGDVIVFSGQNEVIFNSNPESIPFPLDTKSMYNRTETYTNINQKFMKIIRYDSIAVNIMGIVLESNIRKHVNSTLYIIIIACILSILGIISLLYIFTTFYSNRLSHITSAIKKIRKGDLEVRIDTEENRDELAVIANNINSMCADLSNYIDQVYVSEVKQKSAELKYLQAQINPHFLYNTLESIRMRAAINGALDVSEMIYSLATFFKNSLKTDSITTIEQELEHSKLYLKLFQLRYNDKLTVYYDIDGAILSYSIVKLTLQPLVENYIVHGINLDSNENKIIIRGALDENHIIIDIHDNGCGMSKEQLEIVRKNLTTSGDSLGIGINNVRERLAIVYGQNFELAIDSTMHIGTRVTLTIPARKKGVS